MLVYLLERLRKFLKSVGKKEEKINDLITLIKYKKQSNFSKIIDKNYDPINQISNNFKLAAVIGFFYDENKLATLFKVCENLKKITSENEIYILTNTKSSIHQEKMEKGLNEKVKIIPINEIVHNRLLPWYHINIMKELYNNKEITHFLYLEDDILINKSNFNYWLNSRKILKKFNLIPGFVRTEINQKDNEIYAVDFTKKNNIFKLPKIKINKNYEFVSHKFPYQGMYLYDRELMREHLQGPSSNPDCGHGALDTNFIDPRMINLDLMAKANIGLTYINTPSGFFNRMVTLYNNEKKQIDVNCQIKHLSNKYTNLTSHHGNIKLKDAIKK